MACQQLVAHVEAAAQFLGQISAAQRAQALVGQISAAKVMIQRISGPAEALRAINCINDRWGSFLTAAQKSELALLSAQACAVGACGDRKQDRSTDFWRTLPKDLYQDLADTSQTGNGRLMKLFAYLARCGLRNPAEEVFGAILALYFYAEGIPGSMEGNLMLGTVIAMNEQWNTFIGEFKKALVGVDNAPSTWPGPPPGVELSSPLDPVKIYTIMNCIPLRSSNIKATSESSEVVQRSRGPQKPRLQIQTQTGCGIHARSMLALGNAPARSHEPLALMDAPRTAGATASEEKEPSATLAGQAAARGEHGANGEELAQQGRRISLAEVTAELAVAANKEAQKSKEDCFEG